VNGKARLEMGERRVEEAEGEAEVGDQKGHEDGWCVGEEEGRSGGEKRRE